MIKFDVKHAISMYESHSHVRRPRNFQDYKIWKSELEKEHEKIFWTISWLEEIYVWYDPDVDYWYELDRLKYFWYIEYRKDFAYRYDQSKLWWDYDDAEFDWFWRTRCYII